MGCSLRPKTLVGAILGSRQYNNNGKSDDHRIIIIEAVSSVGTCSQYSWRQTGGPFYFLSTVIECSLTFLDDHDEDLVMRGSIMMLREVWPLNGDNGNKVSRGLRGKDWVGIVSRNERKAILGPEFVESANGMGTKKIVA